MATQGLFHISNRLHPRHTGVHYLLLLFQRRASCLAPGQGGVPPRGCRPPQDSQERSVSDSGQGQHHKGQTRADAVNRAFIVLSVAGAVSWLITANARANGCAKLDGTCRQRTIANQLALELTAGGPAVKA